MAKVKARAIFTMLESGKKVYIVKRTWWFFWVYVSKEFATKEDANAWIKLKGWDNLTAEE